ncbi:hypothetical protein SCALM49S_06950 [Streptomyces californicus]
MPLSRDDERRHRARAAVIARRTDSGTRAPVRTCTRALGTVRTGTGTRAPGRDTLARPVLRLRRRDPYRLDPHPALARALVRRVLRRVHEQVLQHLAQPLPVRAQPGQGRRAHQRHPALGEPAPGHLQRVVQHLYSASRSSPHLGDRTPG